MGHPYPEEQRAPNSTLSLCPRPSLQQGILVEPKRSACCASDGTGREMPTDVRDYVKSCVLCQMAKHMTSREPGLIIPITVNEPWKCSPWISYQDYLLMKKTIIWIVLSSLTSLRSGLLRCRAEKIPRQRRRPKPSSTTQYTSSESLKWLFPTADPSLYPRCGEPYLVNSGSTEDWPRHGMPNQMVKQRERMRFSNND